MQHKITSNRSDKTRGINRLYVFIALTIWEFAVFVFCLALTPASLTQAKVETNPLVSVLPLRGKIIKTSGSTTCATTSQNMLWCWGDNNFGQLGNGSTTPSSVPVPASQMPGSVDDFAVSAWHTCVVSNGDVWCVGKNDSGQLGNGTSTNSITPTRVSSLPFPAVQLSVDWNLTCALLTDQTVWCWGMVPNSSNGGSFELNPIKVNHFAQARQVSVTAYRYCIVYAAGYLECVGSNANGEVNGGQTLTNVVQIAQAFDFVCALTNSNAVKCWGANSVGQLGDGSTLPHSSPAMVYGMNGNVKSIYAKGYSACALLLDDSLQCWGQKAVTNPATLWKSDFYTTPTSLTLSSYRILSFTPFCAVDSSGSINCIGYLRGGENNFSTTPVQAIGLVTNVSQLTLGTDPPANHGNHACVLVGQSIQCWGLNQYGQIGDGTGQDKSIPTSIFTNTAQAVYAGGNHTCAVLQDNSVQCWGRDFTGVYPPITSALPISLGGFNDTISKMVLGSSHACALYATGAVNCWGNGYYGQLGNGSSGSGVSSSVPIAPIGLESSVMDIASGSTYSCAVLADHSVKCWGGNYYGALGLEGITSSPTPTLVSGITNAIQIDSTFWHTCATLSNGGVKCWGYNNAGQLGDGSLANKNTPVDVVGLSQNALHVSAGNFHTCALMADGNVQCWGNNTKGELGNGTTTSSLSPITVIGVPEGFTKIETGNYLSCGITTLGAVKCWGGRTSGQLGNGQYEDYASTPTGVNGFGKHFELFLPNTIRGVQISY